MATKEFNKVVKSMGYCYDGTGFCDCYFLDNDMSNIIKCSLFNVKKNDSQSLEICNRVYGKDYIGMV